MQLIHSSILPELGSENHFLKIRAFQIYFKVFNDDLETPSIMQAVDAIFNNLSSNELPVKFYAALAFSKALEIESLKPLIL
jgi:hypothetical protein